MRKWCGQAVLAVSSMYWTSEVHKCIREGLHSLKKFLELSREQIEETVAMVRGKLNKQNRTTLQALIVLDVHAKDVVHALIEAKVASETDFNWLAQLRYYWEDSKMLTRMINCMLPYSYEYLGNTGRLVITPLTDRCYR